MASIRSLVVASLVALAAGISVQPSSPWELRMSALSDLWNLVRHGHAHSTAQAKSVSFLRNLDYTLKFRICNVFPSETAFDVYHNEDEIKQELPYKSCFEYKGDLRTGDNINFKVQGLATGSFTIDDLPTQDSTLVLVVTRHDASSMAVTFQSHAFANLASPQIAVIDAYKGKAKAGLEMKPEDGDDSSAQKISFNSVVAVDEGSYKVTLKAADTTEYTLNTASEEAYVLIRCGVESDLGTSWKQELVLFPSAENTAKPDAPKPASSSSSDSSDSSKTTEKSDEKAGAREVAPSLFVLLLLMVAFLQC